MSATELICRTHESSSVQQSMDCSFNRTVLELSISFTKACHLNHVRTPVQPVAYGTKDFEFLAELI